MKYKQHDKKNWISRFLDNKTSASWDPLLFCVCANLFNCIVSIQNNGSEEYRIYPDGVSFTTIIKFGRVEVSKYVHLKCIREVFGMYLKVIFLCMCIYVIYIYIVKSNKYRSVRFYIKVNFKIKDNTVKR